MTTLKTTDVAFAINFSSSSKFFTLTFAGTFSTLYYNGTGIGIKVNPYNSNWVDIDDNWAGKMVTVDYTKATSPSPSGLTRIQWIDAVVALYS